MTLPSSTPSGVKILNRQERDALKKDKNLFGKYIRPWNESKLGYVQILGSCMELIAKSEATTEEEWAAYYLKEQMTIQELERLGAKWAFLSGLDTEVALAHIVIHALDETWDGWERENQVMEFLNQPGLFKGMVYRPSYDWDVHFGIDLALAEAGAEHGFIQCYQVKPPKFFSSISIGKYKQRIINLHKKAEKMGLEPVFINADDLLIRGEFKPIHWSEIEASIK